MRLHLSLVEPAAEARPTQVTIDAIPGACLRDLLEALGPGLNTSAALSPEASVTVDSLGVPLTTTLGLPPLLDGAHLTIRSSLGCAWTAARPPATSPGLLELHAIGGPDTGLIHDLRPGRMTLGRGAQAHLRVRDPSLSRIHAELTVTGRSVTVRDVDSTNGTSVDGIPIGPTPSPVAPGAQLRTGDSRWEVRTPVAVFATTRPDGQGHLLVCRGPRRPPMPEAEPIAFPSKPEAPARQRLPLLAAALPLALSAVLAVVMNSPTMLLFGLMSPVLLLATWLSDRRAGRRTSRADLRRYAAATDVAARRLADALETERTERIAEDPDPARQGSLAKGPLAGLWDRTGEPHVRVRVGMGTVSARQTVHQPPDPVSLGAAPVVLGLAAGHATGIIGPAEASARMARWLIGQLALRYSPNDLHLSLVSPDPQWGWVTRLPHSLATADPDPRRAVVLCADGARSAPPSCGQDHLLALAAHREDLPSTCTTIIDLTAHQATVSAPGLEVRDLAPDGVPQEWAELVARRLGPLRDANDPTRRSPIPHRTTLLDVLAAPDQAGLPDLAARWRRQPRTTLAPIGATAAGSFTLDLVRDGPHALVAGTTGAGKSELLVSLVAALAVGNQPDELTFVLIDYKGGAAFGSCRALPHVVGMVTDLDHQLTERALVSLDAELKRRERIFAERGVADLAAYQQVCRASDPKVARLVIVVDEFRSLAEELPAFVDGLVRVASLGRSLGVHLIVATQRPGGVVTADMRANLGLRIALRVRDTYDSIDVIESSAAASIAERTPGRAFVVSAATPLTEVQTALASAPSARTPTPPVRVVAIGGVPVPLPTSATELPTQLDDLVASCRAAVRELGIQSAPTPWLPPLAAELTVADLEQGSGWPLPLGRQDWPTQQRQADWTWDPISEGHLAIVGAPRTGRSCAAGTVAAQLATRFSPDEIHLYAVHTGSLVGLEALPHTVATVQSSEVARLARMLAALRQGESADQRDDALRVLLVDDWDRVCEELDRSRASPLRDQLAALLTLGPRERLAVCLTGGRGALSGGLGQFVPRRLLLLPADPVDLAMAGVPARSVPEQPPPGRAMDVGSGVEVQIAAVGAGPTTTTRAAYLSALAAKLASQVLGRPPSTCVDLPRAISVDDLSVPVGTLPVGTDGEHGLGFRLGSGERRIAVLGSPGSGRTTTLRTLAAGLAAAGRHVAVIGNPSEFPGQAVVVDPNDVESLISLRRQHPDLAVLVDDIEMVADTRADAVVREILRLVDTDSGVLVAAGSRQDPLRGSRSVLAHIAAGGVGILLGRVSPGDEAALGVRGTLWSEDLPGRGHLVRHGEATPIQVALTDFPPRRGPS